jgi:long-subunit acyl-CoA synthetase (AMP-forming)
VDDVLILGSGENVVPAPMEDVIMSSPLVGGALIFGRGRNQVGVLLEPRPGVQVDDLVEFRNKIWYVRFIAYTKY